MIILFIIFNNSVIYAYPTNFFDGHSEVSRLSTFKPCNYEIDYSRKHNSKFWRHEDGHAFTENARVFYDIPGMKMIPCRTYQEYANTKQIVSNNHLTEFFRFYS